MGNIKFDKDGIIQIKEKIVVIKDQLDLLLKDNSTNLDIIKANWRGRRANSTLSNIDKIKTNNDILLEKVTENIDYIQSVILIYEEASKTPVLESTVAPTPSSSASKPTETPNPTAVPIEPSITPVPSLEPAKPTETPNPIPIPTESPITPVPSIEPTKPSAPTDFQEHGKETDYTKYNSGTAMIIGSSEFNKLPPETKERLNQEYQTAISNGVKNGGTKGGLSAAFNFYVNNNLGIPFNASGKHDVYKQGLDTNLKKGENAPNSASWLQMLLYDVTGEKKANLRLNNNTNLNGTFLQGEEMKKNISNVSSGDIFFNKPKNPNDSSSVGHAYLVVGKENNEILVAELGHKGLTITSKTEEELSKLDGLTILNENT